MPFRDDHIICIEIGSHTTRSILGLSESLTPPKLRTRTRVGYRHTTETYICGADLEATTDESDSAASGVNDELLFIDPIVAGEVKDWTALTAFFNHLLYTLTGEEPGARHSDYPVVLVVPLQWSRADREKVTKIFLEEFLRPAFMIMDMATASLYACNTMTGIVVDFGYSKTDITPIIDSIIIPSAASSVGTGGADMSAHLASLLSSDLPINQATQIAINGQELFPDIIEIIKTSDICEVLVENSDRLKMAFQPNDSKNEATEEGVLDIAAVVASGKTREYLARVEAEKAGQSGDAKDLVPNSQLTHNTVRINSDLTLVIGQARFKVGEPILNSLTVVEEIYRSIMNVAVDPSRRKELWENVVITGCASKISGFKEALLSALIAKYTSRNAQSNTDPYNVSNASSIYPQNIRLCKIPIHFPEWNSQRGEDTSIGTIHEASFLGAQIMAHIAFSSTETGSARLYITRADYMENGPPGVHL